MQIAEALAWEIQQIVDAKKRLELRVLLARAKKSEHFMNVLSGENYRALLDRGSSANGTFDRGD